MVAVVEDEVLSGQSSALRLRSGREHWTQMVAVEEDEVEVRQVTLDADGRSRKGRGGEGGHGLT